jgi:hypothetical protein
MNLDFAFDFFGSDKGMHGHRYGEFYESKLAFLRDKPITLLEIGLKNGGRPDSCPSLEAWRTYLPKARIVGLDIRDFRGCGDSSYGIYFGDQGDESILRVMDAMEGGFDIVVDDGSHETRDIMKTFDVLFPRTRLFYFIEDLHPSYNGHVCRYLDRRFNGMCEAWCSACCERFVVCVEAIR